MNSDNPFTGKSVAGTGKLVNYTRAGSRLLDLGVYPTAPVSKRTGYLIVKEKPGNKLDKAQMQGITILSEREFENMAG